MDRITIPVELGPAILNVIAKATGREDVAVILIAIPMTPAGQPDFLTNLPHEEMENILIQIGAQMTPEMRASIVEVEESGKMN